MNFTLLTTILALCAYLLGSISFAVVISKMFSLPDPHTYGSKNPGATNVLRTGNKLAAVLTLLGDALKGLVAIWLAQWVAPRYFLSPLEVSWATAAVAIAVFIGHIYPVFYRFAGGKGVATAAGVAVGLHPWLGLAVVVVWIAIAALTRTASLASIVAAIAAPLLAAYFTGVNPTTGALFLIAILLIWRHRQNIQRLRNGTETKIRL